MATTMRMADHRGLVFLDVVYDEATAIPLNDPEMPGGIADADLIEIILTNNHTGPVSLNIRRANGARWHELPLPPGVHRFPAGGPVRKLTDLGRMELAVNWRSV